MSKLYGHLIPVLALVIANADLNLAGPSMYANRHILQWRIRLEFGALLQYKILLCGFDPELLGHGVAGNYRDCDSGLRTGSDLEAPSHTSVDAVDVPV